jgi:hypothetical protein
METSIKIKPVIHSLQTLDIFGISLQLNKTASVSCAVRSETLHIPYNIELTEEEYSAWGNDDNYIVELVISKLGLEIA